MLRIEVKAGIGKEELMSALRQLTVWRQRFDPGPWSVGDAEDLEAAARLIRRGIEEARIRAYGGDDR